MIAFPTFSSTVRHLLVAVVWLLLGLSASARQADVLRRVRLSHWGIAPHNFSGIAPLGENRFAMVSDKDSAAGFHVWHIEQDALTGAVVRVVDEGFRSHSPLPAGRPAPDYEGVAFEPEAQRIWIADEATQQIRAYRTDGFPTGDSLFVPADVNRQAVRPNRGFEALTYSAHHALLWTAPEEPPRAVPSSVTTVAHDGDTTGAVIELLAFSPTGDLSHRVPYRIDRAAPAEGVRTHLNGVPALCALSDGSLIVMERELIVPRRYLGSRCEVRLYRVCAEELSAHLSAPNPQAAPVSKHLLARWDTRLRLFRFDLANYEGLCLGRRLADGRQTLLCVSDAQGGAGRWFLRLHDVLRVVVLPAIFDE
jgi:putative lipoprotein